MYPFQTIAVAVAFSPRCEAILAEAKKLQEVFRARIVFIHVGKKSLQHEQYLKHLFHRFHLDQPSVRMLWEQGDPVDTILDACRRENADLLVAGALEKESIPKYFIGSVARQLSRKAKCSILMLSEPSIHPVGYKHIVVEGADHPKTAHTIATALAAAKAWNAETVDIIQEMDPNKMALIRSEELKENEASAIRQKMVTEEDAKLQRILDEAGAGGLVINTERIEGKPGYVISKFARDHQADLLVLNSPDRQHNLLDRVFPHDIEFALSDLPCNLMIVQNPETGS